jgi:hypothetical protein
MLKWDAKLKGFNVPDIISLALDSTFSSGWHFDYYEDISVYIVWKDAVVANPVVRLGILPASYLDYPLFQDYYGFKYSQLMRAQETYSRNKDAANAATNKQKLLLKPAEEIKFIRTTVLASSTSASFRNEGSLIELSVALSTPKIPKEGYIVIQFSNALIVPERALQTGLPQLCYATSNIGIPETEKQVLQCYPSSSDSYTLKGFKELPFTNSAVNAATAIQINLFAQVTSQFSGANDRLV